MPDFQYQPPTGPLSGSEFERQTTRFFQQVQGAVGAAQSAASAAQVKANEALERAQASNLVDGKTTQADASGKITVNDVAIGRDASDLASARGQIGNATYVVAVDFNTYTKSGVYELKEVDEAANCPPTSVNGYLIVYSDGVRTRQVYYRVGTVNANDWQIFTRSGAADGQWSDWIAMLTERNLGDGFKISSHKVSVPEYDGATASSAGTSGLVPHAAAGQADYVLCGDGEWRDIKTLVAAAQARIADKAAS